MDTWTCRNCSRPVKAAPHLRLGAVTLKGAHALCLPCADAWITKLHVAKAEDGSVLQEFVPAYLKSQLSPMAKTRRTNADLKARVEQLESLLEQLTRPEQRSA